MRMHLKDLLCHSLTQSVSQSVSDKDGHHVFLYVSVSMSLSLYLCTFLHFLCTNSAPALHSQSLRYTHLLLVFCVPSLSQVPDSGSCLSRVCHPHDDIHYFSYLVRLRFQIFPTFLGPYLSNFRCFRNQGFLLRGPLHY